MSATDHSQHLKELETFFATPAICRDSFRLLIHFAIRLAATGHATEVLDIVARSPESKLFHPLIEGLKLHLRLPIESTGHARALAIQIAGKLHEEIKHLDETCAA